MSVPISASKLSPIEKFYVDARARPDLDGLLTLEALNDIEVVGGPSMFKIGPAILEWYEQLRRHVMATESSFDPAELLGRAINDVGRGEPEALRGFAVRQDILALEQAGNHYVKALDMAFVAPRFAKLVRGVSREGGAELARAISNSKDVVRDISIMESAIIGENSDEAWNTPGGYKRVTCGDDEDYHLAFVDSNGCEHYAPRRRNAVDRWYALADAYYEKGEAFPTIPLEVIDDFLPGIDATQRSAVYEQVVRLREGPASLMHGVTVLGLASAMAEAGAHQIRLRVNGRVSRIMHAQAAQGLHEAAEALTEAVQKAVSSAKERRGRRRLINPWDPHTSVNPRNYTDEVVGNARRRDYRASAAASAAAASATAAAASSWVYDDEGFDMGGHVEAVECGECEEEEKGEEEEMEVQDDSPGFSATSVETVVLGGQPTDVALSLPGGSLLHLSLRLRGGGPSLDEIAFEEMKKAKAAAAPGAWSLSAYVARITGAHPRIPQTDSYVEVLPDADDDAELIKSYEATCIDRARAAHRARQAAKQSGASDSASAAASSGARDASDLASAAAAGGASDDRASLPHVPSMGEEEEERAAFMRLFRAAREQRVSDENSSPPWFSSLFGRPPAASHAIPKPISVMDLLQGDTRVPTRLLSIILSCYGAMGWSDLRKLDPLAAPSPPEWIERVEVTTAPYGLAALANFFITIAIALGCAAGAFLPWFCTAAYGLVMVGWYAKAHITSSNLISAMSEILDGPCVIPEKWAYPVVTYRDGAALIVPSLLSPPDKVLTTTCAYTQGGVLRWTAPHKDHVFYSEPAVQLRIAAAYHLPVCISFQPSAAGKTPLPDIRFRPAVASPEDFIGRLANLTCVPLAALVETLVHSAAALCGLPEISFHPRRSIKHNLTRTVLAVLARSFTSDIFDTYGMREYARAARSVLGVKPVQLDLATLLVLPGGMSETEQGRDYLAGVATAGCLVYNNFGYDAILEISAVRALVSKTQTATSVRFECTYGCDGLAAGVGFLAALAFVQYRLFSQEYASDDFTPEAQASRRAAATCSAQSALSELATRLVGSDDFEPESKARRLAASRRAAERQRLLETNRTALWSRFSPAGLWRALDSVDANQLNPLERRMLADIRSLPSKQISLSDHVSGVKVQDFIEGSAHLCSLRALTKLNDAWHVLDETTYNEHSHVRDARMSASLPVPASASANASVSTPSASANASAAAASVDHQPKEYAGGAVVRSAPEARPQLSGAQQSAPKNAKQDSVLAEMTKVVRVALNEYDDGAEYSDDHARFVAQYAITNKLKLPRVMAFFDSDEVRRALRTDRGRLSQVMQAEASLIKQGASRTVYNASDPAARRVASANAEDDAANVLWRGDRGAGSQSAGTAVRNLGRASHMSAADYIASQFIGARTAGLGGYGQHRDTHRAGGGYSGGGGALMSANQHGDSHHGPDVYPAPWEEGEEEEEDFGPESYVSSVVNSTATFSGGMIQTHITSIEQLSGKYALVFVDSGSTPECFIMTALDVICPDTKGTRDEVLARIPDILKLTLTPVGKKSSTTVVIDVKERPLRVQLMTKTFDKGVTYTLGVVLVPFQFQKAHMRCAAFIPGKPTLWARIGADGTLSGESADVVFQPGCLLSHGYNTKTGDCGSVIMQGGRATAVHVGTSTGGLAPVHRNFAYPLGPSWEVLAAAAPAASADDATTSFHPQAAMSCAFTPEVALPPSGDLAILDQAQAAINATPRVTLRKVTVGAIAPVYTVRGFWTFERPSRSKTALTANVNATHGFLPPTVESIIAEEERAFKTSPCDPSAVSAACRALQKEADLVWRGKTPLPLKTAAQRRLAFAAALCHSAKSTSDGGASKLFGVSPYGNDPATKLTFFRSLLRTHKLEDYLEFVEEVFQMLHYTNRGLPLSVFGKAEPMPLSKLLGGRHRTIKMMELAPHIITVAGCSAVSEDIPSDYIESLYALDRVTPYEQSFPCPYLYTIDDMVRDRSNSLSSSEKRYLIGTDLPVSVAVWGCDNVRDVKSACADVSAWDKSIPPALQERCYVSLLRGLPASVSSNLHHYANCSGVMCIEGQLYQRSGRTYSWCSGSPLTLVGNTLMHAAIFAAERLSTFLVQGDDSVVLFQKTMSDAEIAARVRSVYGRLGLTVKEVLVGTNCFEFCKMSYADGRTILHIADILAKASLRSDDITLISSLLRCADAVSTGTSAALAALNAPRKMVQYAKSIELVLPVLVKA